MISFSIEQASEDFIHLKKVSLDPIIQFHTKIINVQRLSIEEIAVLWHSSYHKRPRRFTCYQISLTSGFAHLSREELINYEYEY